MAGTRDGCRPSASAHVNRWSGVGGAGTVSLYDDHRDGVAPGGPVSSPNWDRSVDRVYVDLVAVANSVTVGRS